MSRFDYVKYDAKAEADQLEFKRRMHEIETESATRLSPGRAQALVLTKLEEAYMWIGKAIRDDQIARNGSTELQEARNDDALPKASAVSGSEAATAASSNSSSPSEK